MEPEWIYGTKITSAEGKAHGGFQWPNGPGIVTAPDWKPTPVCGNGLHFWENGCGDVIACSVPIDGRERWYLVRSLVADVIRLDGKVKAPTVEVLRVGDRAAITAAMGEMNHGGLIIGFVFTGGNRSTLTGGDRSTLTGGNRSTLTGGDGSTLTGGDDSMLTGGDDSMLTGGNRSMLTGGDDSMLTGGDGSTLTGGNRSMLTGGDGSMLTGGDGSTLTGGNRSMLTGGDGSMLTGGDGSTLTGGKNGTITIRYHDGSRLRLVVGYVGEGGIEEGKPYRLNDKYQFFAVEAAKV